MKTKTIKSVLNKKFNEYLKSIKDEHTRGLVKANTIITGGAIASMLLKEQVNDFDLYFTNKETTLAVARYYVNQWNAHSDHHAMVIDGDEGIHDNVEPGRVKIIIRSDGVAAEEVLPDPETLLNDMDQVKPEPEDGKGDYRPIFMSTNAITLSGKVQLVIRFYGDAAEIHDNYDFAHCTNYWLSENNELVLRKEALEMLLSRELRYQGSKYPLCSVIRTRKFIQREWSINAGEYLKMCFQLSQLDLTDIDVLEDQLFGVDTLYFAHLIRSLREQAEKDPTFSFDNDYIVSLCDKIFNM